MHAQIPVDVIILSWNRVDDTIAAIRSAASQQGVRQHILIVDQGSDAANLQRLEAFLADVPCATLKKLPRNVGVAEGRNVASAMGQSSFIVALDSDAEFADEYMLARAVWHLERHPELCAIGFRITNYFTGGNDETSWDYPDGNADERFATSRFIGAGHAMRRIVFEAVGGYDKALFFCGEELDLSYRMLNTGHRIVYAPDVVIRHKVSPEHRVFWNKGRFYFTVRNNLYSAYKFGATPWNLLVSATAFFVRAWRNDMPREAWRALSDCVQMCRAFRDSAVDRSVYALSAETRAYILQCEPTRRAGFLSKVRRLFVPLPHQG
ncbi:MAG: glycosyltransferase [Rhodocyclaceae bacterium]